MPNDPTHFENRERTLEQKTRDNIRSGKYLKPIEGHPDNIRYNNISPSYYQEDKQLYEDMEKGGLTFGGKRKRNKSSKKSKRKSKKVSKRKRKSRRKSRK